MRVQVAWLRLPKMIRMYRILRFYKQLQQSSRRPSVVSGIVRFIPLILCLTHISACVWWYIGTVTIDHAAFSPELHPEKEVAPNELQPHDDDEPPLWVHYYSGLGVFELWPDDVAIWKQYIFRCVLALCTGELVSCAPGWGNSVTCALGPRACPRVQHLLDEQHALVREPRGADDAEERRRDLLHHLVRPSVQPVHAYRQLTMLSCWRLLPFASCGTLLGAGDVTLHSACAARC